MTWDQRNTQSRRETGGVPHDVDLADAELLRLALRCAGARRTAPTARRLLAEFGDIAGVLASDAEALCSSGLSLRAAAVLKLLDAFRQGGGQPLLN